MLFPDKNVLLAGVFGWPLKSAGFVNVDCNPACSKITNFRRILK
jgi:hypothetical protein